MFAGYFKNEREGSAQWKELERKAALVFVAAKAEEYVPCYDVLTTEINLQSS